MNFETKIPKNTSLDDLFAMFNTSGNNYSFNPHEDEDITDFLSSSPPTNEELTGFYCNKDEDDLIQSSSTLTLIDSKQQSMRRTSSATSLSGLSLENIMGDCTPMSEDIQKQLQDESINTNISTPITIPSSTPSFNPLSFNPSLLLKPRGFGIDIRDQFSLLKFNKQFEFLNNANNNTNNNTSPSIASLSPTSTLLKDAITSTIENNKSEMLEEKDNNENIAVTTNEDDSNGKVPQGYKIIDGEMYNDRGYKICGFMNQHNRPCQRIGKCPFHDRLKKNKESEKNTSLPTTGAGIIAAQDSIEPEQLPISSSVIEKKSKKKKEVTTTCEATEKPSTKKPYKQGWTKEEHIKFLKGLELHGKGSWKEISQIVGTRTPTQIQSHAQKYFLRQKQQKKNKRSIHDFTMDDLKKQLTTSSSTSSLDSTVSSDALSTVSEKTTHKRKRNKKTSKSKENVVALVKEEPIKEVEPVVEQIIVKEEAIPTFDETMFKNEIFGETFTGSNTDASSILKQFGLSPPKQTGNSYIELIQKLHNLKTYTNNNINTTVTPVSNAPVFNPTTLPKAPIFPSFDDFVSFDEMDFRNDNNNGSLLNTSTEKNNNLNDLYDAWDIETNLFDTDPFAQPFNKKQKMINKPFFQ
ncbi:hypothetical protein ABK040_006749 [Willaertia magna]